MSFTTNLLCLIILIKKHNVNNVTVPFLLLKNDCFYIRKIIMATCRD